MTPLGSLSGDEYEAWVAGVDPATGVAKGHLRRSDNAVRFVEVTVNGSKSWSLAATIHPDISVAYDAAQERAAEQTIGWLAQHATTRIGPRGGQVQIPVQEIEAVTVRHYTSRAGDPHRHLHLQVNARVRADGRWYALHTIGVRDSLDAINGIGHAAMMTDPAFREALAAHGYTLDPGGEITQMREYVGEFSQRAAQIEANLDRYEARWRKANPGQEPGPVLRRRWDHAAWNDARPGKIVPRDGGEMSAHWIPELHALGHRGLAGPVLEVGVRPGEPDRDKAVGTVLTRLAARRSAWNSADIRGEVEQLIARSGVVTGAGVRLELAEDLTARTLAECVPLLDRPGLPEHLRALTSPRVLEVEADITTRLVERADTVPAEIDMASELPAPVLDGLDVAQQRAVTVLAGGGQLVVVEGAAGAGKTTTLAAARAVIEADSRRLVVVTPARKAAQVAATQLGTAAFSASWLAHQHGWRWDQDGAWTRLTVGQVGTDGRGRRRQYLGPRPEAELHPGDVLLVDEAGMLDQDTAAALLSVADEHDARLVLLGDRHQLPAVGRGGVLDLAARYADPFACVELTTVHRFTDPDYADLSLAMRTGDDPGTVFDTLTAKGLVLLYGSEIERTDSLAAHTADELISGRQVRVLVDTNQQAVDLNAVIRDRLVANGTVDDERTVTTRSGQRIGAGDMVMTRRNDPALNVANRETWTVTGITGGGGLAVTDARGDRSLPIEYVRAHVELGYAGTIHTAQGETIDTAHLVLGEHTGAANAYVGMTRGREANAVHILADTIEQARQLWVETFDRDRADLGPTIAARHVATEAERYAPQRPLADALADLRAAWTVEADLQQELTTAVAHRQKLRAVIMALAEHNTASDRLDAELQHARRTAQTTGRQAERATRLRESATSRYASELQQSWDQSRPAVRDAAGTILRGPGRFGRHRRAVRDAQAELAQWAAAWRPIIGDLPTDPLPLARLAASQDTAHVREAIHDHAGRAVEHAYPDHQATLDAAKTAAENLRQLRHGYPERLDALGDRLLRHGSLALVQDPEQLLNDTEQQVTDLTARHHQAREAVAEILREPAIRSQPPDRIQTERDIWTQNRAAKQQTAQAAHDAARRAEQPAMPPTEVHTVRRHEPMPDYTGQGQNGLIPPQHDHGISI